MWTDEKSVFNKKPNFKKLIEYGFTRQEDNYTYFVDIMNGKFSFNIYISDSSVTKCEVIDKATNEEYALVKSPSAVGSFVGSVRSVCEDILNDITAKCYEPNIFKSEQAKQVIAYIRDKYGADAEYLWERFPDNAIFRDATTQKWYAALLTVEKHKISTEGNGIIEIIDLKETPENIASLVDGKKYLAGYHMNKKHWYTICLDESVPIEEIYVRIDTSINTLKFK